MPLRKHADRICKLFRLMMSATLPGEVVAARDAIVNVLQAERQDIHNLADVLLAGIEPPQSVVYRPPSLDEPARDIAAWCLFQIDKGNCQARDTREKEFLRDMSRLWGPLSEKQTKWLASIHNRMMRQQGQFHDA